MADFSTCSAGTLFYGRKSRIFRISKWWRDSTLHSPSEAVDSTKIRLICLYISHKPFSPTSEARIDDLLRLENCSSTSKINSPLRSPLLPCARSSSNEYHQGLCTRQFWLNFMIKEDIGLAEVNFEICKHFSRIPFHHWIQAALGNRTEAVDDLFTSVAMIRHKYKQLFDKPGRSSRVRSLPEISHVNPLTKAIFDENDDPLLPMERIDFVLEPIRTVVSESPRRHVAQNLIILGLRFEAAFIQPTIVDWSTKLSTEFEFVGTLTYGNIQFLARLITATDISVLGKVTLEQLQNGVETEADVRWRQLSTQVEEAILSRPGTSKLIVELAKDLYNLRNYFAMTAIVAGVMSVERGFSNVQSCIGELPSLSLFLDDKGNHEYCRARTIADRGLPWLAPFRASDKEWTSARPQLVNAVTLTNVILQICYYAQYFEMYYETYSIYHQWDNFPVLVK